MKRSIAILAALAVCAVAQLQAVAAKPIRVLVWDEQQTDQKKAYGDKFLGETIAAHLGTKTGIAVKTATLTAPEQGVDQATLDATDVIIWWGHQKNLDLTDANAERVASRVREGKLSLIALHSAHWAKPFVKLMQDRAKADALLQVPTAERATAKWEYLNENPIYKGAGRDARLTPWVAHEGNVWKLTLPQCVFPEPFHVPTPDAVVFEERWDKGEHFRSGCVWTVGQGRVFYFRPGHETYPVYQQAEPLRVLENAVRWLASDAK